MTEKLTVRPRPCATCPYRRDVPSGIWAREEYEKLRAYDGDTMQQMEAGATRVFMCHQADGKLCAGWAGCHDMEENLAMRFSHNQVDSSVYEYQSPVPLFDSGSEAADHGEAEIKEPSPAAQQAARKIERARERRKT